MISRLPRQVQLKLEQTLAQWQQWQCDPAPGSTPTVIKALTPGIGNFSVLVEAGAHYVVRIDGLNPAANGLNRQTEWRALSEAHKAGIAPCPRYFNPELGSLVCDFLPPDDNQDHTPGDVAKLLRTIHALPARHHRLDLAERILRYEKLLEHREYPYTAELHGIGRSVSRLLENVEKIPGNTVLCHNDLLRANRIYSGGRLWALDWEYCAMGNALYDLAVVIHGDTMPAEKSAQLVEYYLGRAPHASETENLQLYGCLYRYLELLWYLALDRPALDRAGVTQKLSALRAMLAGN